MKVYIGCAITEAPGDFSEQIKHFKAEIKKDGHELLDFIDLAVEATPAEVYKWDIENCVKNCQAFVAIVDHPSTGLGFELGEAARLKKDVLVLSKEGVRVTRLIRGAAELLPSFTLDTYDNLNDDGLAKAKAWLKSLTS